MEFQEQYQFECFVRKFDVTGDSSNSNSWFEYLCLRTDGSKNFHDFWHLSALYESYLIFKNYLLGSDRVFLEWFYIFPIFLIEKPFAK